MEEAKLSAKLAPWGSGALRVHGWGDPRCFQCPWLRSQAGVHAAMPGWVSSSGLGSATSLPSQGTVTEPTGGGIAERTKRGDVEAGRGAGE